MNMSLYMDDILLFGTPINIISKIKLFLESKFEMKDMNETSVILRVKVIRKVYSILLFQEQYTEKLFKKFDFYDFRSLNTRYDPMSKLKQKI